VPDSCPELTKAEFEGVSGDEGIEDFLTEFVKRVGRDEKLGFPKELKVGTALAYVEDNDPIIGACET